MVLSASRSLPLLGGAAALVASGLLVWPAPADAQVLCAEPAEAPTGTNAAPHPAGIRYRFASGDFRTDPSGRRWIRFLTEPTITEVDPAGPAAGRLDPGDVIETVDGMLVTTLAGSRRFARTGGSGADTVALGIRRAGRALLVRVPPCAAAQDATPPTGPTAITGGSGIRLRCMDCRYRDGRWSFSDPPRVIRVRPDGPAGRAGLRAGDELVAVDGLRLGTHAGNARFSELMPGHAARWTVRRDGTVLELAWTVGR